MRTSPKAMATAASHAKVAFSIDEISELTGCCRTTLYQAINAGTLRARKFGRRTLVARQDFERWFDGLDTISTKSKS